MFTKGMIDSVMIHSAQIPKLAKRGGFSGGIRWENVHLRILTISFDSLGIHGFGNVA